jgi:hypothetical protein
MAKLGRPRLAPAPLCPKGHVGVVQAHGTRPRRGDDRFERPIYRCTLHDADGNPIPGKTTAKGKTFPLRHTFTLPRRAQSGVHPDGEVCDNCEHKMGRGDGAVAIPSFTYALIEGARLATHIGEGRSLRESSQQTRLDAKRDRTDIHGHTWPSRQNALAADYLDQFGPIIVRAMTPRRWPRVVILDSLPLRIRPRGAVLEGFDASREGGAVLVAAGRERDQPRARTWLATLAADETEVSWTEFLNQLESDPAPTWVVADGAKAIRNAVTALWPNAVFYPCEFHLRKGATTAATADGNQDDPSIVDGIKAAFYNERTWDALGATAIANGPSNLLQWWYRTEAEAREMVRLKAKFEDCPNGNGAAEWPAGQIRDRIIDRKKVFRNATRLATVIGLMGIELGGEASATTYARILRTQFERSGWKPGDPWNGHDWQRAHDWKGENSSLDELIFASWRREDFRRTRGMAAAQVSSLGNKVAAVNVVRLAYGVEPLTAELGVGRKTASVRVAGLKLDHFPELLAEWDQELNTDPDPKSLDAGTGVMAHWVCPAGHHYEARIKDRTKLLTGCRVCRRSWADKESSLAARHPDLLPEWDDDGNAPLTPDRVKSNSPKLFSWHCLAKPSHPSYRTSVLTRVRRFGEKRPSCPLCRATERVRLQKARPRRRAAPAP